MSNSKRSHTPSNNLKVIDKVAFEELYITYYEKLCVYLLSYTSDKKLVEDVVQDTFITIWKKRQDIEISDSIKSYLYRAVYNKMIDTFRKSKKVDSMLSEYFHTALVRAADSDTDHQTNRLKRLNDCIDQLPSRCKKVFVANKISLKKYQEVADDLEISLKTVEGHITRAFKLIRECMDDKSKKV